MILIVTKVAKRIKLNQTDWCMPSLNFKRLSKRTYPCLSAGKRKRAAETKAAGCARPCFKRKPRNPRGTTNVESVCPKPSKLRWNSCESDSKVHSAGLFRSARGRAHATAARMCLSAQAGTSFYLFCGQKCPALIKTKTNALKLGVGV